MPNVFDQFDTPAKKNVFDQFDTDTTNTQNTPIPPAVIHRSKQQPDQYTQDNQQLGNILNQSGNKLNEAIGDISKGPAYIPSALLKLVQGAIDVPASVFGAADWLLKHIPGGEGASQILNKPGEIAGNAVDVGEDLIEKGLNKAGIKDPDWAKNDAIKSATSALHDLSKTGAQVLVYDALGKMGGVVKTKMTGEQFKPMVDIKSTPEGHPTDFQEVKPVTKSDATTKIKPGESKLTDLKPKVSDTPVKKEVPQTPKDPESLINVGFEEVKPKPDKLESLPQDKTDMNVEDLNNLNVGFNPGIDKFYAQDIKPLAAQGKNLFDRTVGVIRNIPKVLNSMFQSAFPVIKKFGKEPYAEVIKGIHETDVVKLQFDNARSNTFDANFKELEKHFAKYSKEELDNFNYSRGDPHFEEAKQVQDYAKSKLPNALKNPKLIKAVKDVSDWVYNYAKRNGIDMNYFEDYFFGAYKDPEKVQNFVDYWRSTDKYTKEKTLPTIADAHAFGLELKDNNPITNLRNEANLIAQRVGLLQIKDYNLKSNAPYVVDLQKPTQLEFDKASSKLDDMKENFMTPKEELINQQKIVDDLKAKLSQEKEPANMKQKANWRKIEDPVFKGQLFDPDYAKFVNNLISTNKISSNLFLKGLRSITHGLQAIKYVGSIFHLKSMLMQAMATNTGGVLNPRWAEQFAKGFKPIDMADPEYQEYVKLAGNKGYSVEVETMDSFQKMVDRFFSGNVIGAITRIPKVLLDSKYVPVSPGFVKWMFNDFIPKFKYDQFKQDVFEKSEKLGRPLTDGEKIESIRKIQQRAGEMDERLYGRSGTVTSALRFFFMAPGYGEGNFRTLFSSMNLKDVVKNEGQARSNLKFVINSLANTAALATIGTLIATGKPPDLPKKMTDIRDLFKIKTGAKDGNGDDIYIDLMSYEKDYWSMYGNLVTGQIGNIPNDLTQRFQNASSRTWQTLTDLSSIMQGRQVYDYAGNPIYYKSDSFPDKVGKFLKYEIGEGAPISSDVFSQSESSTGDLGKSAMTAILGIRPTTSEQVKILKNIRSDLYSMKNEKVQKQIELNKLYKENPQSAEEEAHSFNNDQNSKLEEIAQKLDIKLPNEKKAGFLINNFNEKGSQTVEQSVDRLFEGIKNKTNERVPVQ